MQKDIEDVLKSNIAGSVIVSIMDLWKIIDITSVILIVFQIPLMNNMELSCNCAKIAIIIGILSFILIQFLNMRLYFDKSLFENLYKFENIDNNTKVLDILIKFIFNRNNDNRTMESRWIGSIKLIKLNFLILFVQILTTLLLLFIYIK